MTMKRIEAYVIRPSGQFRHECPSNGIAFQLTELIRIVGGCVDIIELSDEYQGRLLVVARNEKGRKLKLQPNAIATRMAGTRVHGDALVCERHLVE